MRIFLTLFFLCAAVPPLQAQEFSDEVRQFIVSDAPLVALTNIRIVDGTGAVARDGQTLILRDGRITGFGAGMAIPEGAVTHDFTGHTVIPGLVMLHEHLYYTSNDPDRFILSEKPVEFPRLYLAAGVTTARTAGSVEPYTDLKVRQLINEGRIAGPKFDITAPYLDGDPSQFFQLHGLSSPEEAREMVAYWAGQGATSIKLYTRISKDMLAAAIDEAHSRGLKVAGHLCSVTYRDAAELKIDNLEHGFVIATDFLENKEPDTCPGFPLQRFLEVERQDVDSLIKTLVENNVAITSTLAVLGRFTHDVQGPNAAANETLGAATRARYLERQEGATRRESQNPLWTKAIAREMAFEKAFVEAGGLLVAGSDTTGIGGTIAGFANHEQIILLVAAGFSPLEAIKIATHNGAVSMGRLEDVGTIETGKAADLVIIKGRPDENIADITNVRMVFKDGIGYDPDKLIASVRGRVEN